MIAPEKLLEAAKALEPQLQEWRRTLHRHPEVGFDLPQTKALVKKALTEMGYAPQDCGKCGVLALAAGVVLWRYHRVAVKQFGGITGDLAGWFLQKAELYMLAALVFCQWKGFL